MQSCTITMVGLAALILGGFSFSWSQEKTAAEPKADLQALVQGNNEFAFDLYARLAKEEGNIIFSPYSISTALAMTYGGARDETAEKMARAMHFTLPPDRLHAAFRELIGDVQKVDKDRPYDLHVANALWGQKGIEKKGDRFMPEFLELTHKNYHASLREVDFIKATEPTRLTINRWVEQQTKEKIKDLLPRGILTIDTRLVITNAIYMKAQWKARFDKELTKDGLFEVTATQKVLVPMMRHPNQQLRYFAGGGFQWLEMPYKGDRLSMVLLLPQKKGQLADLEKTLTPTALQKGLENLYPQVGEVVMPRFTMTLHSSLLDHLTRMGLKTYPLTHIAAGENLQIAAIVHKAYIDVDEAGTEAAASTAVVLPNRNKVVPFTFRADHRFLFLIRDAQTGCILFLGRVRNPSQTN